MALAINRDGDVLRQIEEDDAIGVPAVVGRYAFLPWQEQYVTVFDLQTGSEVARALLRTPASRVFLSGGAVFFGGAAATRLDGAIGLVSQGRASTVALPSRDLPGNPIWMTPGTEVLEPVASASDKVRLYARPTASGAPAIESGIFAATYFRIAVGFDATQRTVAWARAFEADLIGGAACTGGFALCDARGEVTLVESQHGAPVRRASLGRPVDVCVVQTDGLKAAAGPATEPLAKQLEQLVMLPQADLLMMQRLLLRELAALQDDGVTKTLIDLAIAERTPPLLREDARKALAARRRGATFMLDALRRSYDFLADVPRPPPVGPLADALAAMDEKRAAPLLAKHLNDPETSPEDAQRAAAALVVLASKEQLPALRTFFALYRGVRDKTLTGAVLSVAEALVKLGDVETVTRAANDAFTSPDLRERLAQLARSGGATQGAVGR
jgi:outer membrane protein assembly factor BamB